MKNESEKRDTNFWQWTNDQIRAEVELINAKKSKLSVRGRLTVIEVAQSRGFTHRSTL